MSQLLSSRRPYNISIEYLAYRISSNSLKHCTFVWYYVSHSNLTNKLYWYFYQSLLRDSRGFIFGSPCRSAETTFDVRCRAWAMQVETVAYTCAWFECQLQQQQLWNKSEGLSGVVFDRWYESYASRGRPHQPIRQSRILYFDIPLQCI